MLSDAALRFVRWLWRLLVRRAGLYGLFCIAALHLTLFFVVLGLREVVGGLQDVQGRLFWLVLLSVLFGRTAGRGKQWGGRLLLAFALASPLVFLWIGDLGDELALVVRAASDVLRELAVHLFARLPLPDFIPGDELSLAWFNFSLEAWTYLDDIRTWFADLRAGQPAFQARAVLLIWGQLVCGVSLWAAAVHRRTGNVLPALFPAGAVLLMTLAFSREPDLTMMFLFMLGVLVLVAAGTQHENERRWQLAHLDHPDDMRLDFSITSSVLIGGILLTAIIVPSINVRTILRGLIGIDRPAAGEPAGQDGLFGESLGIVRPTPLPPFFSSYFETGMPRSHLLGMPPERQHELVLKISLSGPGELAGMRYYWRALAYDVYTGTGWAVSKTDTVRYTAGAEIPLADLPYALTIRQNVEVVNRQSEIAHAAGDIISVDHPFEAAWRVPAAGSFDAFGVRVRDRTYVADSRYPVLHAPTLRKAGTDYPDWVTARYLALPVALPQEVRDLAAELTAGAVTPYDQARALENYLRRFPYTLSVPLPPSDRDLVDYFLFELQRGYCDYYASAMVVMARSIGLPARLAIGFAEGRYDAEDEMYYVTGKDAHSWPEIYFPGFGWVPFEPTAGLVEIEPLGLNEPPVFDQPDLPLITGTDRHFSGTVLRLLAGLGAAATVIGAAWLLVDRVRSYRQSPTAFYEKTVQELYRRSRKMGVPLPPRATPAELTEALSAHLIPRLRFFHRLNRFPGKPADLSEFCERYNRIEYSSHGPSRSDKEFGLRIWRSLRWKLTFIGLAERSYRRAQPDSR